MTRLNSVQEFVAYSKDLVDKAAGGKRFISVCGGTGCIANRSDKVLDTLKEEMSKAGVNDVEIKTTGCPGFCEQGPLISIMPKGLLYVQVKEDDAAEIISESIVNDNIVERLTYKEDSEGRHYPISADVPFYKKQTRVLLADQEMIDPANINDYIAQGGYTALAKALGSMSPDEVVSEVSDSGLRGRGGAGYPTGKKWSQVAQQSNPKHYIICNADEGDPGAFMDRALLEGNPHAIVEGMLIGAYGMRSDEGYVYAREEYPLAVKNLGIAIKQAEEMGLMGDNILGTEFSFKLHVYRGAGAFVCGESTALVQSIMGNSGEPRHKPPRNAERGLFDCPTNINNVETWVNVPHIINKGAEWFKSLGTDKSTGTKIFSLVGMINNTGLVEVPMGITLREVIFDIGGGIPGGKTFKAVQTGGPSGGCLPEEQLDLPIDFDSLDKAGSIMGSGGMIVMDEETCMVNIAKYFTDFNLDESCGKCTSCREGLYRLSEILTRVTEGRGRDGDITLLEELSDYIKDTSLCGLGKTAPNPTLSTLRYFKKEYEAHINERRCPAKVCKELVSYWIDTEKCIGCGACKRACPSDAVDGEPKENHLIHEDRCIRCGQCYAACPRKVQAVTRIDRYAKKEVGL